MQCGLGDQPVRYRGSMPHSMVMGEVSLQLQCPRQEVVRSVDRVVPEVVAAEAFTKLRHDRSVSGRRDARPALAVFSLLTANPEVFEVRGMPGGSRFLAVEVLANYVDQNFSWVDAVVLLSADDDRRVQELWTVDASRSVMAAGSWSGRLGLTPRVPSAESSLFTALATEHRGLDHGWAGAIVAIPSSVAAAAILLSYVSSRRRLAPSCRIVAR